MTPRGVDLVAAAMRYAGRPYVLGAEGDLDVGYDPAVGALDCSELVQVAAADLGVAVPDGHWQQWRACADAGLLVDLDVGYRTPGALLFVYDGTTTGHVAISRGDGSTIEARGRAYGVGVFATKGRGFTHAGLAPGFDYAPPATTQEIEPMLTIHHPTSRVDASGALVLHAGKRVLDFAYLPNDGQELGPLRVSSFVVARRLPGGDTSAVLFTNGSVEPLLLPDDGRTVAVPVRVAGLVSVVGDGVDAQARELWARV
jgi:hypothetical protein